jgi:hypothetical protein
VIIDNEFWKQSTFRKYFVFGRSRIDSTLPLTEETDRPVTSKAMLNTFLYVFGAAFLLVVAIIIWSVVDDGVDTMVRLSGQVVSCRRSIRAQLPCAVRLETGVVISVYMLRRHVGDKILLARMRRPVSGDEYYVPAD